MPAAAYIQEADFPHVAVSPPRSDNQEVRRVYQRTMSDPYGMSFIWSLFARPEAWLSKLEGLEENWDGDGGEAPNRLAKRRAHYVLEIMASEQLPPPLAVMPSAEGGIAITLISGDRRGSLEFLNSGEMIAALYEGRSFPLVWEFNEESLSISDTIEKFRDYLSA